MMNHFRKHTHNHIQPCSNKTRYIQNTSNRKKSICADLASFYFRMSKHYNLLHEGLIHMNYNIQQKKFLTLCIR